MAIVPGERLVLGSIPRPDLRQLDQMADLSSTYRVRGEEPGVERETRPSAAITVADALVDREQAVPEPENVMCESGAHSLARDRRRAKP